MADDNGLKIKVTADTKPAEQSLDSFGDKANSLGKKLGVALAGYLSFQAVKEVLTKSVDAALEADRAVKEFNNSLAMTGKYTEAASISFQNYAGQLQKATGISDEVILKGASSLITLGKVAPENLNRVSAATLDLATAMQVDAGTAFDIMTKAANGNTMALKRYGISASEGGNATEKFSSILGKIEGQFGGLAARNLDPFTSMKVSIDELFESIGKIFTKNSSIKAVFLVISEQIGKLAEKINDFAGSNTIIKDMIKGFFDLGSVISRYVIAPFEVFYNYMVVGLKVIGVALADVGGALAGALGMDGLAQKSKDLSANLQGGLMGNIEQANSSAKNAASTWVSLFDEKMGKEMQVGGGKAGLSFSAGLDEYFVTTGDQVAATAAAMTDNVVNALQPPDDAGMKWDGFFQSLEGGFENLKLAFESMNEGLRALGKQLRGTLVTGFSNSFAAMGKALVKGENLLDAFAQSVLGVLGDLALQMSTFFIAQGVALLFTPGGSAQGAGLIAAGAALGVVGGILKALSGGGGGGAESAAGGASSSASDIGGSNLGSGLAAPQERALPQTGVQVIVQGNILNSRESALEIAQVLNDSFDTNGTYIRATG